MVTLRTEIQHANREEILTELTFLKKKSPQDKRVKQKSTFFAALFLALFIFLISNLL